MMLTQKWNIILLLVSAMVFAACSDNDDEVVVAERTIMVYFNSENNMSEWAAKDMNEIVAASSNVPENVNVLAFYYSPSDGKSLIYKIANGVKTVVKDYGTNLDASSSDNMLSVFQTMVSQYPAKEYITFFWGHGTGAWITDNVSSRAYGADFNGGGSSKVTWINIPEMADVLKQLPKQRLIMFDACLMQSVEVDYELKDCADYIISPCCETPTFGANLQTLLPILATTNATALPKAVIDDYTGPNNQWAEYSYQFTNVVISAVKTSELDNLLNVTKSVMDTLHTQYFTTTFPADAHNATNCIFYYRESSGLDGITTTEPLFHDLKDVMRHNLCDTDFNIWCQALTNAVVYKNDNILKTIDIRKTGVKDWIYESGPSSDFYCYYVDDETCGALSMYIPDGSSRRMNTMMKNYKWWQQIDN